MLVLGRKPGEYVVINDIIKVKVIKSDDGLLRLAIEAPQHINIIRGELLQENNLSEKNKLSAIIRKS